MVARIAPSTCSATDAAEVDWVQRAGDRLKSKARVAFGVAILVLIAFATGYGLGARSQLRRTPVVKPGAPREPSAPSKPNATDNASAVDGPGDDAPLVPDTPPTLGPPRNGSVVELYGHLQVREGALVSSKTGQPVTLRGMSLFWSQWMAKFWNRDTVRWLREDWNVTLVRAAMAIEQGGYLENPEVERARLETIVDAAITEGIYVIIDWHEHNAEKHVRESRAFFQAMAAKYGKYPNVLFEVFNEPIWQQWHDTIKPYHQEIVGAIRNHSDNLVILGTRKWSQDVDEASLDPVRDSNLAYTVHFYASSHRQELRKKVEAALANGVAVFATEWGTCDSSGDGDVDLDETDSWMAFLAKHGISDANWAVGDKREACSALKPGASVLGGWAPCDLTRSGAFVRARLRMEAPPPALRAAEALCPWAPKPPDPRCARSGFDCSRQGCCQDAGHQCYEKNRFWSSCKPACSPGIDMSDPPEHRTPWTCALRTQAAGLRR